jgi:hypothetical protein
MGQFTIEFYRTRERDEAHATLDKVSVIAYDLEAAKTKAASRSDNLDCTQAGRRPHSWQPRDELCRWSPESRELKSWR